MGLLMRNGVAYTGNGAQSLYSLSDVSITSPSDGQVPVYDTTAEKWENQSLELSSSLNDVDIDSSTLADGQVPRYNAQTGKWENGEASVVAALDDLTDVDLGTPASGDLLFNDGSDWVNKNVLKTVTMAQYNAMVEAETVDPDVNYFIPDMNVTGAPVDDSAISPNKVWSSEKIWESRAIFSNTEQEVGTWLDTEEIVYVKTFNGTIPANAVTSGSPYRLVDDNSIFIKEIIGGVVAAYPLPCYTNYGSNSTISTIISDHFIDLYTNVPSWANGSKWHITVVYTKTTDPTPT